jgi:hypothetical protein
MVTVYAVSTFAWVVLVIAFVVIWAALEFWPARVARRKGHSFIGYFIFSLFFFPLALVTAYVVQDRAGRGIRSLARDRRAGRRLRTDSRSGAGAPTSQVHGSGDRTRDHSFLIALSELSSW